MPKPATTLAALALSLLGATAAGAQETLRLNHVLGPSEPFHQGFTAWAERVSERTNGALKIEVFHSGQLGVEEDIIEQIRAGAAIGQNTDAARLGTYVPEIAVVNGPYFLDGVEDIAKLAEAPSMVSWQETLAREHGLKVVCFDWVQGFRHFFTNAPVRRPEDLSGLRIRTPPAPIWQKSVEALGASPTAMAFGDMYPALQQQAIDGVELVYNNIPAGRFYEVLTHANETRHILLTNFQVVSASWFDALPTEHQTILVEECRAAGQATSKVIAEREAQTKADLAGRGMTIVGDVDIEAFRAVGESAYAALGLSEAKARVFSEIGK